MMTWLATAGRRPSRPAYMASAGACLRATPSRSPRLPAPKSPLSPTPCPRANGGNSSSSKLISHTGRLSLIGYFMFLPGA